MRLLRVLLIILFFVIGITSEHLPKGCDPRPFVGNAFLYFIIGISVLILAKELSGGKEKYSYTPPPPPLISKESCRLSKENHCKAKKVLSELNAKLHEKPNFPPDRLT